MVNFFTESKITQPEEILIQRNVFVSYVNVFFQLEIETSMKKKIILWKQTLFSERTIISLWRSKITFSISKLLMKKKFCRFCSPFLIVDTYCNFNQRCNFCLAVVNFYGHCLQCISNYSVTFLHIFLFACQKQQR